MSIKKAWILYTLLRLFFFAVPFVVLMLMLHTYGSWGMIFALLCATLISFSLSVLLLGKLRARAAEGIEHWRKNAHQDAASAEDYLLDTGAEPADNAQQR